MSRAVSGSSTRCPTAITGTSASHRNKQNYHVVVLSNSLIGVLLEGRYRVDAVIASGGMSTVYRGLDIRLDRPVALKVMDSRYANDPEFLTRFQLEARAVARLKDPGLVAVYDQGIDAHHPFLVMELIEGGTLRELLIERGPMPPHAVVAVLEPALGGLAVAHRAGLIHRDIKPENVLISDDGEVKLVDFGLVRALAEANITSTNVILGTSAYLSPEQVSNATTGPRSDVYAMGILTYELFTGKTPFSGDNPLAVAYQRIDHDVPAPSAVMEGIPPHFDTLVIRATSRDPNERYADAAEMASEIRYIISDLALPNFRVPAPRNSALHSVARHHSHPLPAHHPTRQLTRDFHPTADDYSYSDHTANSEQFGGVMISELVWAQQRARRMMVLWLLIVLVITGLVAGGSWELGSVVSALLAG